MSDVESLLPPNSTQFEKDMEQTTARLGAVPTPLRDLHNPATCPAEQLPWLAWALSVDNWNSSWPEAVQREVIAASAQVHRIKGTRHAVNQAIAAQGSQLSITEWFENDALSHTFRLGVIVTEWPAASWLEEIKKSVDASKRLSAHYTIDLLLDDTPNPVFVATAFTDHVKADSRPHPRVIEG